MKFTGYLTTLMRSDKAGGIILIAVTALSLLLANSIFKESYIQVWSHKVAGDSIVHWINDGLMAIFFLLIGLELKREIIEGKLSSVKTASFPVFGAIGGMIVPAAFFTFFNYGTDGQTGVGIPMATDIAFAVGILSILGTRVPLSLKLFLTALAVVDDLGAIIVIALFYSKSLDIQSLLAAFSILAALFVLNRLKVKILAVYLLAGTAIWYFMLQSGIHATISGIMLASVIPYQIGSHDSPSHKLEKTLHKPVALLILPLFAVSNTSITLGSDWITGFGQSYCIGIMAGLIFGKPLGIYLFTFLGTKLGLCRIPQDLRWRNIAGVGFLGGIGFTMSIFITLLAYDNSIVVDQAKVAILASSLIAAIIGLFLLNTTLKKDVSTIEGK